MNNSARLVTGSVRSGARLLTPPAHPQSWSVPNGIHVNAQIDERRNLYKPIRVTPEQAQTLQWLTPGNVVRYEIVTTLDWWIE